MDTHSKKIGNSKTKPVIDKFVRIKNKGQVTIPKEFWKDLGINVGDFLRIGIKNGWIILIPQLVIDKKGKPNPLLLRKVNFPV